MRSNQITQSTPFLKKPIPLYYLLILVFITALLELMRFSHEKSVEKSYQTANILPPNNCQSRMSQVRGKNFKYIQPLLLTDLDCESEYLGFLKKDLSDLMNKKMNDGVLLSYSVYVRKLHNGEWICLNNGEKFNPGSLMKIPVLISWLKESEKNPKLLDREITFTSPLKNMPEQTKGEKSIQAGKKYKVRELLHYMIAYSDNNATHLLMREGNMLTFKNVFVDLGMNVPEVSDRNFTISTSEYSRFMRVLFSSTYLNTSSSEYALNLLSQSTFKDGMLKQLPAGVTVSHKFGEFNSDNIKQLHEAGIIYINNNPILVTVMTKGNKVGDLSKTIGEISRRVYDKLKSES